MTLAGVQKHPAFVVYRCFWTAVDWLYPPFCGGCGKLGERWCADCQKNSVKIVEPICRVCGTPQPGAENSLCISCQTTPPNYTARRSWAYFQGSVREAIHRLKYQNDLGLGEALAHHLIEVMQTLDWPVNLVIPVPLSNKRWRERGYNQAGLLAYPLALALRLPYSGRALWRTRETHSQVGLSAEERAINLVGAFGANSRLVHRKIVLVVDDVTTTGSTLDNCSQALLEAGAEAVYGLTLARTAHPAGDSQ